MPSVIGREYKPQEELNLEYVGFWVRSSAAGIDSVIVLILILIAVFIAGTIIGQIDAKEIGERFSLMVMHFLASKVEGLQNMQMGDQAGMSDALGKVLRNIDVSLSMILLPIHLLFAAVYYALPESRGWQGSIGKHLVGIKIVGIKGERISFFRAMARNVVKTVPGYFFFWLSMVIYIPILFDGRKRGAHDMMCKTYVVYKK